MLDGCPHRLAQRLAVDLAAKTQELDHLSHKLRTFNEDHAEEVEAGRFQVMQQDKVIKGLQAEVQQLRASMDWPRSHTGCQTQSPECTDAQCQAVPHSTEASQQTHHQKPQASNSSSAATQTEAVPGLDGPQGTQQQHRERAVATVCADTQTEPTSETTSPSSATAKSKDAQKAAESQSPSNNQSLAFDLQVLTKKFERVVQQKIEADEAALQAHNDVSQLIKLCEFYKSKAESAIMAHMSLKQSLSPQSSTQGAPQNGPQTSGTVSQAPTHSPHSSADSPRAPPQTHHHGSHHLPAHQLGDGAQARQQQGPSQASPAQGQNGCGKQHDHQDHNTAKQATPPSTSDQTQTVQHCHSNPREGEGHQRSQQGGMPAAGGTTAGGTEHGEPGSRHQQAGVHASNHGNSSASQGAALQPAANGLS